MICFFQHSTLIGHWQIAQVYTDNVLQYDRVDSNISKVNFIYRQNRIDSISHILHFDLESKPYAYSIYAENVDRLAITFSKDSAFEQILPFGKGSLNIKGKYYLNKNKLFLHHGTDLDTMNCILKDSTLTLFRLNDDMKYIYKKSTVQ